MSFSGISILKKKARKKLKERKPLFEWQIDWDGSVDRDAENNIVTFDIASPKYKPLFENHRYKVYHGGRGGAKSRTFARVLLLMGMERKLRILCAREIQLSIRDSVKKLLDDEIDRMGLGLFYMSLNVQIRGNNGTEISFTGLRALSVEQVKSYEGVDIVWCEEAQTLSQFTLDILIPTIRKEEIDPVTGEYRVSEIWFSFNPRYATDAVYNTFVGNLDEDAIVIEINWDDNRFFPSVLEKERLKMQARDPEKYLHIWEGSIITMSEARIFKNWEIREFETPSNAWIYLGADWGLQIDPSCLVGCWFDDETRTLYIDREVYEYTTDIADLPKLFNRCPGSKNWDITYDSSRPELGRELKKHGFRMKPARKGAGSIMEGLEYLQSWNIVVHPKCKNTIYELSNYAYKVDKHTGEVIQPAVPEDKNNHIVDSLRYATESRWRKQKNDWIRDRIK